LPARQHYPGAYFENYCFIIIIAIVIANITITYTQEHNFWKILTHKSKPYRIILVVFYGTASYADIMQYGMLDSI
jgi:hypothetical protein